MSAYVIGIVTSLIAAAIAWLVVRLRKFGREMFQNQRSKRTAEMVAAIRAEMSDDGNGSVKSAIKRIESMVLDLRSDYRSHVAFHKGRESVGARDE